MEEIKTFSDVIRYQGRVNPDRVCIHDIKSQRSYSYKDFDCLIDKTAAFLHSHGVKGGDRVTAVFENSPEYCFFYFATLRMGAIFNPMPFIAHKEEIKKNIDLVEPALVVMSQRRESEFEDRTGNIAFVPVGVDRLFEKSIEGNPVGGGRRYEVQEDQPACLYYSSGTTSDPKGVLFSHRNMISNISSICRGFRFSRENEVHLVLLPLGHTASINYSMLPCFWVGGRIVLAEDFWHIRTRIWKLIEKYRITYMETVPTVLYSILNIFRNEVDDDISSLRFVGCGSAPLQKTVQIEFETKFNLKVANLYGLSETGPSHVDYPLAPGWKPGSIGVPLDVNEVKILDENDREVETYQAGEIVVKGDNVFVGYFGNDSLYRKVVRNGYFYTGDLGYKDENGLFHFMDRKKDLIIKGGINIVPGEIDEVLMQHPAVKEGLTLGVADPIFGEEIRSYVVTKDGMSASTEEIIAFCRRHLSKIKIPKEIVIVEDLPKTHSGKLLRRKLKEP
jgi:long-chain acyl-CoA synthetase